MNNANSMAAASPVQRPRWIRIADVLSVMLFGLVWGALALRVVAAVPSGPLLLTSALLVVPVLLLADLLSGVVHWFADRYFEPTTLVIGPMLIEPFREHHLHPQAMTRHGFCEVCGNNGLVTLFLAPLVVWLGPPPSALTAAVAVQIALILLAVAIFLTNQVHAWAHLPTPPAAVATLQRWGVLLRPAVHRVHHRNSHDRSYCITTGWLNAPLDRLGLFARLERALAGFGLHAHEDDPHARRHVRR